jgi:3-methyladenine DNA glycosylase AlkD
MLRAIGETLIHSAKKERIEFMQRIAPGITKVEGVPMPVLNALARQYQSGGFDLILCLWSGGGYEDRMLAVKILIRIAKKDPERSFGIFRSFLPGITEWSICDTLGMGLSKALHRDYRDQIFSLSSELAHSANPWERRMSLVLLQFLCRFPDLHCHIRDHLKSMLPDKSYYVLKAIAWIQRDLKKHADSKTKRG